MYHTTIRVNNRVSLSPLHSHQVFRKVSIGQQLQRPSPVEKLSKVVDRLLTEISAQSWMFNLEICSKDGVLADFLTLNKFRQLGGKTFI